MDGMARSDRATFRLPAAALFVPVLLFVCITPLATVGGQWWVLYIVPVLALVWVLITHTRATADRITTFGLLGSKAMTWAELDQLELPDARWAIAVGQDGRRLRLPMVRPRDVPRLVAVSGGSLRLDDPAVNNAGSAAVPDTPAA
ncbi:MAG: PH domain-containing protein, partial [Nakamurella sp.]